jgi:hypothetical protein
MNGARGRSWHVDDVERPLAAHLVGDMDVTAAGVLGVTVVRANR